MAGGIRPTFKTREINTWLDWQFRRANSDREVITKTLKDERRRKSKASKKSRRDSRRRRRDASSRSSSSGSSSESALNALGDDTHDFRRLAREHPGVTFASVVADTRVQLGLKGEEADLGSNGPVFWKWWEHTLPTKVSAHVLAELRKAGEVFTLVTALDELRQGRFLEVADILASRTRALAYNAEGGSWKVAREFLTYVEGSHSLVSEATEDAAARLVQKREKRDRNAAKAGR